MKFTILKKWKMIYINNEENIVDYKNMKIKDLLKVENDEIIYGYGLGDSWKHNIILEKNITA